VVPVTTVLGDGVEKVTSFSPPVVSISVVVMITVMSEVAFPALSLTVVETAVMPATTVLVDGVETVTFSFSSS
jgi:hypothetical protein